MTAEYYKTKTEIGTAFQVSLPTVHTWFMKKDFPKKDGRANGWSKAKVTDWVDAHNEKQAKRIAPSGDRAEKTKLECERLRIVIKKEKESLKVAELETKERSGKLADVELLRREYGLKAERLRSAVEGWRSHNIAKHPDSADLIDALADDFVRMVRDA